MTPHSAAPSVLPTAPAFKQSACWWCMVPQHLTPVALIEAAAEIGYAALELVDEKYWPQVHAAGLAIAAHHAHGSIVDGLNQPRHRENITREVHTALEQAVRWSIPTLICFSGNRYGPDDATAAGYTAETLASLAPLAEQAGVTLVLELLNSAVDHPGYQCDHTAWGAQVIDMVNSPRVKLLYDIYHMQIMEGDIIRTIGAYHQQIGHYHTAGNPGRHEIDDSQELNYRPIMRAIAATGYTGYVGQEFIPLGDPLAGLVQAFKVCDLLSGRDQ